MNSRRGRGLAIARLLGTLTLVSPLCMTPSCVTENLTTGEVVPRGKQKLPFEKVEEAAKELKPGMNKTQVLMLLGSPAEMDQNDDVWIYLPERYGIVIPARALRVEFKERRLVDHGYRAIVLGARL